MMWDICAIVSARDSQLQKIAKGPEQSFGAVTGAHLPPCLSSSPLVLDIEGGQRWCKVNLATGKGALLRVRDRARAPAFHLTIYLHMEGGDLCCSVCAWDPNQVPLQDANRSGGAYSAKLLVFWGISVLPYRLKKRQTA